MRGMKDLFDKVKLATTTIPNNETAGVQGRMQMRPDIPGRTTEGLGTPWGEGELSNDAAPTYSTAVENALHEGREELLARSFEGMAGMASDDRKRVKELFENFGSSAVTSHSPLLQKKADHAPPPTLAEAVRRLR